MSEHINKNIRFFAVRGYQKSGTNWVGNLLNLHPKIIIRGEFHFGRLYSGLNSFFEIKSNQQFQTIIYKGLEDIIRKCLIYDSEKFNKNNVIWYGDQTPGNIRPIFLKDSPHIIIFRDGRDVIVSQIFHRLRHAIEGIHNAPQEFKNLYKKHPIMHEKLKLFKSDTNYFEKNPSELLDNEKYIKECTTWWNNFMVINLNIIKELNKNGKNNILIIKYEDLFNNTEKERSKLYEFLNLDPKEAMALNSLTKPKFDKTNNLSLYRKGIVGDWKNYFTSNTCKWFKEIAGKTLIELEYEKDLAWNTHL